MFSFLLPIASKIVSDAIDKIPDDAELGEKLIDLCLLILKKAVKLTKTDMDDKLLAQVETAIKACLLYTSPSPRDMRRSRMPSSA